MAAPAAVSGAKIPRSTPGGMMRDGVPAYPSRATSVSWTVRPKAIHPSARAMVDSSYDDNGHGYCFEMFWNVETTKQALGGAAAAIWAPAAIYGSSHAWTTSQ